MACYAITVVEMAKKEVGYHEKQTNANLDDFSDNSGSGNYTKYADYIDRQFPQFYNGKKQGAPWCEVFVDAMFIMAYGYRDALRLLCQPEKSSGAGVNSSIEYYSRKNRMRNTPSIGAQVFFKNGSNYHTGIVEGFTNDTLHTIEGNADDSVKRRAYSLNDVRIIGYGTPDFDGILPPDECETSEEKAVYRLQINPNEYSEVHIVIR